METGQLSSSSPFMLRNVRRIHQLAVLGFRHDPQARAFPQSSFNLLGKAKHQVVQGVHTA